MRVQTSPRANLLYVVLGLPAMLVVLWAARWAHGPFTSTAPDTSAPEAVPPAAHAAQSDTHCREESLPPPRREKGAPSNYLKLSDFSSVLVADSHGHSEYPLNEGDTGQRVDSARYDRPGESSVFITTPAEEAFTFTFKAGKVL